MVNCLISLLGMWKASMLYCAAWESHLAMVQSPLDPIWCGLVKQTNVKPLHPHMPCARGRCSSAYSYHCRGQCDNGILRRRAYGQQNERNAFAQV